MDLFRLRSKAVRSSAMLVDVRFLLDLAPNAQPVQDGYVDIHPARKFRIRVGKFKAPVGLERLQPTTALMFSEFALPTSLVPNREVGTSPPRRTCGAAARRRG